METLIKQQNGNQYNFEASKQSAAKIVRLWINQTYLNYD